MDLRKLGLVVICAAAVTAVADDLAELRQTFLNENPGARLMRPGPRVARVYGAAFGFGNSAEETADQFRLAYAEMFGVSPDSLRPGNAANGQLTQPVMYDPQTGNYKFTLVYYRQFVGEIPVYRSSMLVLVRNEPGFPLVWVNPYVRDLGDFQINAAVAALQADEFAGLAQAKIEELTAFSAPRTVIWAGVDDMVVEPRLAVEIIGDNGNQADQDPQKWLFIMDAATGKVLHSENLILNFSEVSGTVRGMATVGPGADVCGPEAVVPLPYARVSVGGTIVFADVNGFYSHNPGGSPVNVTSTIRGRWFRVQNSGGANASITAPGNPPNVVDFLHNAANTSEFNRAEVNAYVQANIVRDFTLSFNPSFPVIAGQTDWTVNVNISSTCNAFYNGTSINFYRAGGGCANTAFDGVVHHEYGHHLVAAAGSGQGAYGEGLGDVMGVLILDDPRLGLGFQSCASGLRNADNNLQFPCSGGIHFCGQLLSGCVWSTRTELLATNPGTYREIISNLTVNSILLHTGSDITPVITIDFLTLDDDDGNIGNGTPHYGEIAAGFGAHSMDAPPLELLEFRYPSGRPDLVDPAGGTTLRVEVLDNISNPQAGSGRFFYDTGAGFIEGVMNEVTANVYDAVFPASECGETVRYYFSAETTGGQVQTDPNGAPVTSFSALSATGIVEVFVDNFETNTGWTVQNLGATSGDWQRGVPINDPRWAYAPITDSDGSGRCFLTENDNNPSYPAPYNTDVDNGAVRLTSPTLDLSADGVRIQYDYYLNLTNTTGGVDRLLVEIDSNDGAGPWTEIARHSSNNGRAWTTQEITQADLEAAGVTLTSTMKMRFTANDANTQSIVEAGIDAFAITTVECGEPCDPCDMNCDGTIDALDIEFFIDILFNGAMPCDTCTGDTNGDGTVDAADIEGFIDCLFF